MQVKTEADVVVIGAGMAGLCAVAASAQRRARVLLVERAPVIGGSAALSHGTIWTVRDAERLSSADPGRYQRLGGSVVAGFDASLQWIAQLGESRAERIDTHTRRAQDFDLGRTFLQILQRVHAAGGGVRTSTTTDRIERSTNGFRLTLKAADQPDAIVEAGAVVIATGGRQANPTVRAQLAGPAAVLRGNPFSDGAGIELARSLGAAVNFDNRGFYGHLFPRGVAPAFGLDLLALALYHSAFGVLLDRGGHRFTDERVDDARNALALAGRGGDGLLAWSEAVQARAVGERAPAGLALDRWAYARDRGAQVVRGFGERRREAQASTAARDISAQQTLYDDTLALIADAQRHAT